MTSGTEVLFPRSADFILVLSDEYDEARYLLVLQKRQSPLLKFAAQPPV